MKNNVLCILLSLLVADVVSHNVNVTFKPPGILRPWIKDNGLKIGSSMNVTVVLQRLERAEWTDILVKIGHVECRDVQICEVEIEADEPRPIYYTITEDQDQFEFNVTVTGAFVGKTHLDIDILVDDELIELLPYPINVLRSDLDMTLNLAFTGFIIVFITINTFMMGTQLHWRVIWGVLKKPIGPFIGFICQYVMMPILAFTFATILISGRPSLQFGYFAVGCSPGGGASNFWTLLLDGNLDLSVTMTFISNVAALFMMPAWLYTAGRYFYSGTLVLPIANIMYSLLGLLIPAGLGLAVGHCKPNWVPWFKKVVKIFTIVLLIILIALSSFINVYIFHIMHWYTLVPGLCLPWAGYALSFVIARFLFRQNFRDAITIGIETGIQNGAIAIFICQMSLASPDSDLTLVMPVSVMMFTGFPLWVAFVVYKIKKCCCDQKDDEEDMKNYETSVKSKPPQDGVVVTRIEPETVGDRPNWV